MIDAEKVRSAVAKFIAGCPGVVVVLSADLYERLASFGCDMRCFEYPATEVA